MTTLGTSPSSTTFQIGVLLGVWLIASSCTQPRSPKCKEICQKEADCVDATGNKISFDKSECIAACSVLEADVAHSAAKVRHHAECVNRTQSCTDLLECQ